MPYPPAWTEADSQKFKDLGDFFVPDRDLQNQTLCDLLALPKEKALVVEICCGQGLLAERILEIYPQANICALDGSKEMIALARSRVSRFGDRFQVHHFDLFSPDWWNIVPRANAIVSSLAIHHLDAEEKLRLFKKVYGTLEDGGVFLLADIVQPPTTAGAEYAASQWDASVKESSQRLRGDYSGYHEFVKQRWNHYRTPDPRDHPSSLYEQLRWLHESGFSGVDVFWMKAGHAIFGGTKPFR